MELSTFAYIMDTAVKKVDHWFAESHQTDSPFTCHVLQQLQGKEFSEGCYTSLTKAYAEHSGVTETTFVTLVIKSAFLEAGGGGDTDSGNAEFIWARQLPYKDRMEISLQAYDRRVKALKNFKEHCISTEKYLEF